MFLNISINLWDIDGISEEKILLYQDTLILNLFSEPSGSQYLIWIFINFVKKEM